MEENIDCFPDRKVRRCGQITEQSFCRYYMFCGGEEYEKELDQYFFNCDCNRIGNMFLVSSS